MAHIHLLMDPVLLPRFGYHEQCCCEHGVQTLAHAQLSVPMVIYLGVESSHPQPPHRLLPTGGRSVHETLTVEGSCLPGTEPGAEMSCLL